MSLKRGVKVLLLSGFACSFALFACKDTQTESTAMGTVDSDRPREDSFPDVELPPRLEVGGARAVTISVVDDDGRIVHTQTLDKKLKDGEYRVIYSIGTGSAELGAMTVGELESRALESLRQERNGGRRGTGGGNTPSGTIDTNGTVDTQIQDM